MALRVPRGLALTPCLRTPILPLPLSDLAAAILPSHSPWTCHVHLQLRASVLAAPALPLTGEQFITWLLPRIIQSSVQRTASQICLWNLIRGRHGFSSKPPSSSYPLSEFHLRLSKLRSFHSLCVLCPFNHTVQWQGISFAHCYIPSPVTRRHLQPLNEGMNG